MKRISRPLQRRTFLTLLGGAVSVPLLAARAQSPAMPVVGLLEPTSPDTTTPDRLRAFQQGMATVGFVEGENVAIEYRWAENKVERLSALAAGLVRRHVAVIAAIGGSTPAFAASLETGTIPIVFTVAQDPVKLGLVSSLAKPDRNSTGVFLPSELPVRRLQYLRELVPAAARISVLLDPANAGYAETTLRELEGVARSDRLQINVLHASSPAEIDAVFAGFERDRPHAVFVGPFPTDRRVQLALLAALHRMPASYPWRDFVDAGGLMSYGASLREAYRQAGVYVGRILKGAKPADLPVVQSTRYELAINASTARMLGLSLPSSLRASADVMIE
ncbi:MAG TPA: ABC transporter substrate-binding protein [Xanthobacteraceae bacterium]|jgi:putative ABC transport system substrate-binding protein